MALRTVSTEVMKSPSGLHAEQGRHTDWFLPMKPVRMSLSVSGIIQVISNWTSSVMDWTLVEMRKTFDHLHEIINQPSHLFSAQRMVLSRSYHIVGKDLKVLKGWEIITAFESISFFLIIVILE